MHRAFVAFTSYVQAPLRDGLIDYLIGVEAARAEIGRYDNPMINPITWMEVLVGTSDEERDTVCSFLSRFHQIGIDAKVAEIAVTIRRRFKLRPPDDHLGQRTERERAVDQPQHQGFPGRCPRHSRPLYTVIV